MKKGPGELLAVGKDSSLQLGVVIPLEPHEVGDGVVLQKLIGGGIGRNLEASAVAVGVGGGSRWEGAS